MTSYSLPGHYAVFEKPYSLSKSTLTRIKRYVKKSEKERMSFKKYLTFCLGKYESFFYSVFFSFFKVYTKILSEMRKIHAAR